MLSDNSFLDNQLQARWARQKPRFGGQDRGRYLVGSSPHAKDGSRGKGWQKAPEFAIISGLEAVL
jgi:hypothetical protein